MIRAGIVAVVVQMLAGPAAAQVLPESSTRAAAALAKSSEILREVRVHGNHTTPEADILGLAGLTVDAPVSDAALNDARARLERSGRFDGVELRKRFRSLDDPGDILVVILVEEVPAVSVDDLTPGPFKRLRGLGMWLPVLDYADGYGFTYGARITFVDTLGKRSRVSVPLTWGGDRRVALEADRTFSRGLLTRVEGALSWSRRENPHFEIGDTRREVRARGERAFTPWLKAGGGARWTKVHFAALDHTFPTLLADVVVDTRLDPAFPRNAVYFVGTAERLRFAEQPHATRWSADAQGFVGLFGASVVALRATSRQASTPLPPYEQALLGGTSTLRGYRFGAFAGDNLTSGSIELRVPVTSPLTIARLGVKGFLDAGTVYASGQKLSDQQWRRSAGGGVFLTLPVLRVGLDVAWPLGIDGRRPRWHFTLGSTF